MYKRTEVRYHHTLSDGSHIAMYFACDRNILYANGFDYDTWRVGLAIGKSRRICNDWWNKKDNKISNKSTGKVGLEGLLWAKQTLVRFMNESMRDVVQVIAVDYSNKQRMNVYKRLCKTLGFVEGTYNNKLTYMKEY